MLRVGILSLRCRCASQRSRRASTCGTSRRTTSRRIRGLTTSQLCQLAQGRGMMDPITGRRSLPPSRCNHRLSVEVQWVLWVMNRRHQEEHLNLLAGSFARLRAWSHGAVPFRVIPLQVLEGRARSLTSLIEQPINVTVLSVHTTQQPLEHPEWQCCLIQACKTSLLVDAQ